MSAGAARAEAAERSAAGMLPVTRLLLLLFSSLTLLAVVVLYGRPADTGHYFAWTIQPPLTAAFLGGGYGAGCVLVAMAVRDAAWSRIRVPLLIILVFTLVTLAATLLHLEKFHLHGPASVAVVAGWFWLGVYLVVPPLMFVVWLVQQRREPVGPAAGMPRVLAVLLGGEGLVMITVGVALFARPSTSGRLWPWPLTPLTARTIAAWLIAFGLATCYAARWESLDRGRIQALAYTAFGLLELLALARFHDTPDWHLPVTWLYLAFLVAISLTGAAGLLLHRRHRQHAPDSGGRR